MADVDADAAGSAPLEGEPAVEQEALEGGMELNAGGTPDDEVAPDAGDTENTGADDTPQLEAAAVDLLPQDAGAEGGEQAVAFDGGVDAPMEGDAGVLPGDEEQEPSPYLEQAGGPEADSVAPEGVEGYAAAEGAAALDAFPAETQPEVQEYAEAQEQQLEGGPVDTETYDQQLPHPFYPAAPEGDALDGEQQQQQQQHGGELAQAAAPAAEAGLLDEAAQLEAQRQALEAENVALLAQQEALQAEQQAAQVQQLEEEQYMGGALPEAGQYDGAVADRAYQEHMPADMQYEQQAGDMQYEQQAGNLQYEQQAGDAQYGDAAYGDVGAYGQAQEDAYGGYAAMGSAAPAPAAVPAAPAVDVDALLAEEREKHEQQLKLETRAREELEDMILRIEKHFKAEQAARKMAEELLQAAIAAEMDAKNKLEDVAKRRTQEQRLLDDERTAIKRERQALESMRQEFENELQAARTEVAKAQEALAGSEERIRSAEQVERARLESEYQSKLMAMQAEMERMREEMTYRTMVMQEEMENWRQQAQITANAVLEAKGEVLERKRELDSTKEKMDRLLDKLLMGRERGIELSGAIASNQRMLSYLPGMGYGMPGMGQPGVPGGPVSLPPMGQAGMMKMPPHPSMPQGPWMSGFPMPGAMGGQPPLQQQSSMLPAGRQKLPPLASWASGEASPGPQQQRRAASADNPPEYHGQAADDGPYAHVQSRFAQGAAEVGVAAKARQQRSAAAARNGGNARKKADRFEEAEKEAKRNAAMSRWN